MLKTFFAVLFLGLICLYHPAAAQATGQSGGKKTDAQEARDFAKRFTVRLLETKDFAPLLGEFYFNDFIDRYIKFQTKEDNRTANMLFVPGLSYQYKTLGESNPDDWRKFYVSAHNFILLPVIAMIKNARDNPTDESEFDIVKFYSPAVISLFNKNPNLANMIEKKGVQKPLGSVEELRKATAVLEQAVTIIREKQANSLTVTIDEDKWAKIFQNEYFEPSFDTVDAGEFGFPKGTRFVTVNTPIGMKLILARDGEKLKIVWATVNLD